MKKNIIFIVTFVSIFMFNIKIHATTATLSVSSNIVEEGEEFTVTVTADSAAAWNIHLASSGSVEDCTIDEVDVTDDALNTNNTFSTTCTSTGEGEITLELTGDLIGQDDTVATELLQTETVTVLKKAPKSEDKMEDSGKTVDSPNTGIKTYSIIAIIVILIGFIILYLRSKKIFRFLSKN